MSTTNCMSTRSPTCSFSVFSSSSCRETTFSTSASGIGDHAEAAQRRPRPVGRGLAQAAQHLGAEYLVGGILLPVLDGAAERRGKEQHLLLAQHLRQVVVEVTRLLEVAPDEDKRTTAPLHHRREKQRHGRGTQPAAMHPAHRGIGQQATRSLHVGMGGIELL